MKNVTLSNIITNNGLFIDGDWIESKDQDPNGEVRLIQLADIGDGIFVNKSNRFLTKEVARQLKCTFLQKGDILIARMPDPLGRACIFPGNERECITVVDVCILRPNSENIFNEYIKHLINNPYFRNRILAYSTGATRKRISRSNLDKIHFDLPTYEDQIRIATVLTRTETIISKRKESIKVLDELLKNTFLEMFGPQNKSFPQWPVVEIKDLAANHKGSMRTGPFGSNLLHSEFVESGDVAVLGIDNAVKNKFAWSNRRYITMEKYNELSPYRIFPGDVIITIMGTVGRSAVIPDDIPLAINTKHLAALTLDKQKANPHFISYSIHSNPYIVKQFAKKNRGAIMNGLNLGIIKETKLHKPPIELQNKFAVIVEKFESLKVKYTQSINELENLFNSLSQRAFKGELDLSKVPVVYSKEKEEVEVEIKMIEGKSKFNDNDLVELIKTFTEKVFSFDELWQKIETLADKQIPSRNDIQNKIIELLESDKAVFQQVFDFLSSQEDKPDRKKQIAFRGDL
jgi:type I restriction enzyme, S subunit